MTTTLSTKGQVVIPLEIRRRRQLKAGDDFQVKEEGEDTILLVRLPAEPRGLIDHLCACPPGLEIPARSKDAPRRIKL